MVIKVENIMNKTIKELTLLLIYFTSWQEDVGFKKVQRSWKGYPFEVLDELNAEGYIDGSKHAKSVYLTEEGLDKAKELMKKCIGKEE
jgi:Mn-dependent DtxR family transcriptional regulator